MTGDRPPHTTAAEAVPEAPVDGEPAPSTLPEDDVGAPAAAAAPEGEATAPTPAAEGAPVPRPAPEPPAAPEPAAAPPAAPEAAAAPESPATPEAEATSESSAQAAAEPEPAAKPRPKRPPRPREPLPWPELRAAATAVTEGIGVEELKEVFRLLPGDIRDETVEAVREYRKGARRPVSAFAGKSLARAVHTSRRGRRRPDTDDAVSEAIGQALAAEVIASLDVEVAAEVILPKRDLLERESRNARRRQKAEDDRSRDERRRRAREENQQQGTKDGTYSGAKIRGLDQLAKLFDAEEKK